MKISCFTAVAVFWCASTVAVAGSLSNRFTGNVTGVVQVGSKSTSTSVSQKGYANIAGVIQVSPKNSAAIKQIGRYNAAGVAQASGRGITGAMP